MTDGLARPLRIGRIDYTNVWPVFHHFRPESLRFPAEQVSEMPAALNRKLKEGDIDAAAISSFAYGASSDSYYLLPNLSVSALGKVQSILLFLKSPLEKVIHGKIALTTTSATSVNLLKIIMTKFYGGDPVYEDAEPSLERMMRDADAALLIGDHAIRASWQNHGYRVLDLGEVWNLWTGHWMTFALWAVRREAADRQPEAVRSIYEGLMESKRRASRDLGPIVSKALRQIGGTPSYWRGYFSRLHHDFGPEQQAGLMLYFRYARELGLMEGKVSLTEWPAVALAGNLSQPQVKS
ncbi:ABC transporter substrate-binding protein [Cohnella sp. CFH 77786]|uniref:menaquinone biosynthetic enzyme MqnA/MqnD family protein n=1 Tax=Cohnella sp. CFH 77786 TaxID=2662265 RepID=UPI001C60D656|nr:menaquinone biosynthesis protein [Cohnella sp. CFH 77786]MBW5446638.1 ABC transporter substrate-binding protein [Cohnella sp. CFH 77786]